MAWNGSYAVHPNITYTSARKLPTPANDRDVGVGHQLVHVNRLHADKFVLVQELEGDPPTSVRKP